MDLHPMVEDAQTLARAFLCGHAEAGIAAVGHIPGLAMIEAPHFPNGRSIAVIPQLQGTPAERSAAAVGLRSVAKAARATRLVLILETWGYVVASKEEFEAVRRAQVPKPDSAEMVTIVHAWADGEEVWTAPITRDKDGAPQVGEFAKLPGETGRGRFTGILREVWS